MDRKWARLLSVFFLIFAAVAVFNFSGEASAEQTGAFTGKWTASGEWELLDSTEGREVYTYKLEGPVNLQDKNGQTVTFWSECVGLWDSETGGSARCVWKEAQPQDAVFLDLRGPMVKEDAKISGEFAGGTGQFEGLIGTLSFTWSTVFGDSSGRVLTGFAKDLSGSYMLSTLFSREAELAFKRKTSPGSVSALSWADIYTLRTAACGWAFPELPSILMWKSSSVRKQTQMFSVYNLFGGLPKTVATA